MRGKVRKNKTDFLFKYSSQAAFAIREIFTFDFQTFDASRS